MRDSHTPALRPYGYVAGQGLVQDLVEGQGRAIAGRGLQQDLVPGRGRYTYPGGRGMGCDYNIIVHLEKFSQFSLKTASFSCEFSGSSPEVANWVIMIMFSPRAKISCFFLPSLLPTVAFPLDKGLGWHKIMNS